MRTKLSQHAEFKLFELLSFSLSCSWTSEYGRGAEQPKLKLSSSVLYQMAIILQLFFFFFGLSTQQTSTTSNKFANRGRRAWGFRARLINWELLKLGECIPSPLHYSLYFIYGENSRVRNWKTEMIGDGTWEKTDQRARKPGCRSLPLHTCRVPSGEFFNLSGLQLLCFKWG